MAFRGFSVDYASEELIKEVPILRKKGGQDLYTAILIMKIFELSHPELQSELGDCYYQGDGVAANIEKALDMFQKAAGKGSIRAQYDLGWYYYDRGEYFRSIENFTFCITNQKELDDHKLSRCYSCLGDAYSKISEPKISVAIENLAIAADKYHDAFACRRLGLIYGEPGTHYFDSEKAINYFKLGVSYGDEISAHELGTSYIIGDSDLNILPNGRIAENILLQFENTGDSDILTDLGLLYQRGDVHNGVSKDYQKSKSYYERAWEKHTSPFLAANLGYTYYCLSEYINAEKMFLIADQAGYCVNSDFLGRMYKDGLVGPKDLKKAAFYYGRAYEKGDLNNVFTYVEFSEILEEIGEYQRAYDVADKGEDKFKDVCFLFIKAKLVLNGKVNNRISLERAVEMLEVCIKYDAHRKEAHFELGKYYHSAREFRKAEKQYSDAFSMGVADAAAELGKLYELGGGTINADINKAVYWYEKAANAGSTIGIAELECFKKGLFGGYRRVRSL